MVRACSYHPADLTKAEGAFSCKDIRCPYVRISGFKPSSFSLLMVLLDSVQRTPSACLSRSWWRCRKDKGTPFPPNKIFYTYKKKKKKKRQIRTISYCVHTNVADLKYFLKWTNVLSDLLSTLGSQQLLILSAYSFPHSFSSLNLQR